jgi:plastocyanin
VSGSGRHKSRKNRAKRRARPSRLRSRRFGVLGIGLVAALAFVAVGFLFHSNLTPTTPTEVMPTEVVVIIPKGAGENLHLGFEPSMITIVIGVNNTVIWKNEDSDWHTAHSNIPEFNSGLIQPGGNFTHTFLRAGTYPYHCDPHPWMTGIVIVKAATSAGIITYWPYEQSKPSQLGFASLTMLSIKSEIFRLITLQHDRAISLAFEIRQL